MLQFVLGGLSGMMLALSIVDISYHDTYFVVGQLHEILGVAVVSLVPSVYMEYLLLFFG